MTASNRDLEALMAHLIRMYHVSIDFPFHFSQTQVSTDFLQVLFELWTSQISIKAFIRFALSRIASILPSSVLSQFMI